MEKRTHSRKEIGVIHFSDLTSLNSYSIISSTGKVIDASITGILLEVQRDHFVEERLKDNLVLTEIVGQDVALFLPDMSLDLDGYIVRADHIGKGVFHIAVEFSQDIPTYWRECLVELLPSSEEFKDVI